MARAGLGEPFVVLGPQKAAEQAEKLRQMIDRPLLTDIKVRFADGGAYEVAPEKIPDLLAERPLLIYGKYRGDKPTRIEITGRTGRGAFNHTVDLRPADARKENSALRALWARKWVEILEDEFHMGGGKPVENAITDLGLFYNLLTPFTSFVAIDSEIVNRTGRSDTVRQPLPMPEGVSNYAVAEAQTVMASPAAASAPWSKHSALRMARPMMPSPSPSAVMATPMMPSEMSMAKSRKKSSKESLDDLAGGVGSGGRGKVDSAPEPIPEPKRSGHAKDEQDKKSGTRGRATACKVKISVDKAERLGDTKALLALVEKAARTQVCQSPGTIKLRIAVDSAGKLTQVVLVSGDSRPAKALIRKLAGAISATRAFKHAAGSVELTIETQ